MIEPLQKNANLTDLFNKMNELIEACNELSEKFKNHKHFVYEHYEDSSLSKFDN